MIVAADVKAAQDAPETPDTAEKTKTSSEYEDVVIEEEQLGIYRLLVATTKSTRRQYQKNLEEIQASIPHLVSLFKDIYALSQILFICVLLSRVWQGLEDALLMHLSTRMLRVIEVGLITGKPFAAEVLWAMVLRLLCTAIVAYLRWLGDRYQARLRSLVTAHFELTLMEVKLRLDVPTSLDASSKIDVSGSDAWNAFEDIMTYLTSVLTTLSQMVVILRQARISGDPFFVLVCLIKPIFANLTYRALWEKVCYAYVSNVDYLRMSSMQALVGGGFKEDVLTGDLGAWIIQEYRAARDKLGDISNESPFWQYYRTSTPFKPVVESILDDLPMAYCAVNAVLYPSRFSIASIAIFQSSSSSLRYSLDTLFRSGHEFQKNLHSIKEIYSTRNIRNKIMDGKVAYPSAEKANEGMSFELRDLTFSYPGSHKKGNALNKINLSIKGGSLVVIVGANGSGKSTIVRILSRLFDPTSGELMIDGSKAADYHIADLRQATVLLSQENKIYPLSFAENIGLGHLDSVHDMELVKKAAEQGGATEFISKLDTGYSTQLNQSADTISMNLHGKNDHPLHKEMEKLEKAVNISGGETQRLVAARSFMRFNSGKIRLVVVDEPSSALDAEGELQLFNRLLEAREGKTMIFVTHRFGHLTKHADTIICMKDGDISEMGRHDELMRNEGGEYSKLYNIQAGAFAEQPPTA
ncbi:P-loop containing nucleoside triphosphate hydrolase protein [Ephemerocybe angulata]|uniref:P-loop containing nucleoside triphosphate hydrolase protein n=1 Tax=Ephemerocybe angulata TaxID=980116 RepID=A0A8H6HL43_9AGAR|nr:P-loop containing nucleoside triphosphate hydrolase protein [Tulosesus angulatus]